MTKNKRTLCVLGVLLITITFGGAPSLTQAAQYGSQNITQQQFQLDQMSYSQLQQLVSLLTQLRTRLRQMVQLQSQNQTLSESDIKVLTRSATNIERDEATLRGRVTDFDRSDYVDAWFQYGDDQRDLDRRTPYRRLYEDSDSYFSYTITNLLHDTNYYFRTVGRDEDLDLAYGSIYQFRTDDTNLSSNEDHPDVTTQSATNISDERADLRGYVDMNDFRNGKVFFVYGEDENQIEDVEDEYDTYRQIDEDGDGLQKVLIDSDLDGRDSYIERVFSLDDDTDHYFTICVEYEDEDNDEVLKCGTVREFTTDN